MKKLLPLLTVIICLSTAIAAVAQPFLGLALNDKGGTVQLGVLANGIDITAAYKTPFTKNDVAKIASLSIGKQLLLSHKEEDNYTITASFGFANYRVKDFTKYDAGSDDITQVNELHPMYGLEVGKDSYMGRVFISASYCKGMTYGIGIKMFPYRNN
jgi:hypothetical protein